MEDIEIHDETAPEVLSGELLAPVPPDEFCPDLGEYEVDFVGPWLPAKPGRKNAYREARLDDGSPVVVYENGSIRKDDGSGHWIRSGSGFAQDDNGLKAITARWERVREASVQGLVAAYEQITGNKVSAHGDAEFEAWAAVVKSRALISMDPERGRDGTDAARFVGHATKMMNEEKKGDESQGAIRLEITGRAALEALKALQAKESKDE